MLTYSLGLALVSQPSSTGATAACCGAATCPYYFWDPAGFTADGSVENFKRRRQTELKHGRISMLATLGYITPEITGKFPGYLSPSAGLKVVDTILLHRQTCLPSNDSGAPPPVSTMWKCHHCGSKCRASFQREHERNCRGSVKENKTCSKCQAVLQTMDARLKHESFRRGSETLKNTCEYCSKLCKGYGSRVAHEKSCSRRPAPNRT